MSSPTDITPDAQSALLRPPEAADVAHPAGSSRTSWRALALALASLVVVVPLMLILPRLVPADPSVLSAAILEGYNSAAAQPTAAAWAALTIVLALLAARWEWLTVPAGTPGVLVESLPAQPDRARRRVELILVALAVLLFFWPPFLARYGPYTEDSIFLTALHRMHGGMVPYRDFEFLYGPLMLYPAHWWMELTGYSMASYYWYLAGIEVLQYVLIAAVLQRLVPRLEHRVVIFLILAGLLVNALLGLNYNGLRRLIPVAALLLLARDPRSPRVAASAGAVLGLALAYSHDFAAAALLAAAGLYLAMWVRYRRLSLVPALLAGGTAVAVWLAMSALLLGSAWPAYIDEARVLVRRFNAGEAGFRFYWTVNSVAVFALFALACVIVGRALARFRSADWAWGDRFVLAALLATFLSLKSGLNRSDVWHLDGAFFLLITALLLPLERRAFRWSRAEGGAIVGIATVISLTHLLGNAPIASYVARGWMLGARDVAAGRPASRDCPATPAPCIAGERTESPTDARELSATLATPALRDRPVLFYGRAWNLSPLVGAYKRDPLNDTFLYGEERGEMASRWLAAHSTALVVIERDWYDRLTAPLAADSLTPRAVEPPSLVKSIGAWAASNSFRGVAVEEPVKELRWRRTVGQLVREEMTVARDLGRLLVLSRRSSR